MRKQVLESLHNSAGHQGVDRTVSLLRNICYWVGMDDCVRQWVKRCERCMVSKMPVPGVKPKIKKYISLKTIGSCGNGFHTA